MKSFVKAAALLAISMPLWAADMNTGMSGATGVPSVDCTKVAAADQKGCMDMMAKCKAMPSQTDMGTCMRDMNKKYMPMTTTTTTSPAGATTTTTTPAATDGMMKDTNKSNW
jgi:hypothetical protein